MISKLTQYALLFTLAITPLTRAEATEVIIDLDRGPDTGQNFGSLFDAHTGDRQYIIGAGFSGIYNTYYRDDRHSVHFFIRSTTSIRELETKSVTRPNDIAGTYLFNADGNLYAADPEVRQWDEANSTWNPTPSRGRIDTRVGPHIMSFDGSTVLLDGEVILEPPAQGSYARFYYAQGHLFFYHIYNPSGEGYRLHTSDTDGYSKIYALPWTPGQANPDPQNAIVKTVPIVGEFPYAYGQLADQVLSCSNIGGAYVFHDGAWRTVVHGDLKTSYQVYTIATYYDRLLMGQYPTGELFAFDGKQVNRLNGWPPKLDGVSGSSREAQTMAIYGGELYVGVWPWGEVWKYHQDTAAWSFAKRMFTHPALTNATTHPYERECAALGGVANQWGQRVTSMITHGNDLFISTSAKWQCEWEEKFDFVANNAWKEYGAVTRLTAPGHLSAPITWTNGPTQLRFTVHEGALSISQDDRVIATTTTTPFVQNAAESLRNLSKPTWGRGAYGPFIGKSVQGKVISQ